MHVRQALEVTPSDPGRLQVDGGYLQDGGMIERYKRLSIPVRRALNPTDRASFSQSLEALAAMPPPVPESLAPVRLAWTTLQNELSSLVTLGGRKTPRGEILKGWLEAVAFYDKLERDRAYDHLIDQWA